MIRGAGELGRGRVDCEDRMEEGDTGAQGKGGREKIQEEACLSLRKGCGDGLCIQKLRAMQFSLQPGNAEPWRQHCGLSQVRR